MGFTIDNALIPAIISASVATVILLVKEFILDPRKWKRDSKINSIEKRLEVYGSLQTLLRATREKATRQGLNAQNPDLVHLLEIPSDSHILRQIFAEKSHLLSENIVNEYLRLEREDSFFALSNRSDEVTPLLCNLTPLQDLVELGYQHLNEQHKKLVHYEI